MNLLEFAVEDIISPIDERSTPLIDHYKGSASWFSPSLMALIGLILVCGILSLCGVN